MFIWFQLFFCCCYYFLCCIRSALIICRWVNMSNASDDQSREIYYSQRTSDRKVDEENLISSSVWLWVNGNTNESISGYPHQSFITLKKLLWQWFRSQDNMYINLSIKWRLGSLHLKNIIYMNYVSTFMCHISLCVLFLPWSSQKRAKTSLPSFHSSLYVLQKSK